MLTNRTMASSSGNVPSYWLAHDPGNKNRIDAGWLGECWCMRRPSSSPPPKDRSSLCLHESRPQHFLSSLEGRPPVQQIFAVRKKPWRGPPRSTFKTNLGLYHGREEKANEGVFYTGFINGWLGAREEKSWLVEWLLSTPRQHVPILWRNEKRGKNIIREEEGRRKGRLSHSKCRVPLSFFFLSIT